MTANIGARIVGSAKKRDEIRFFSSEVLHRENNSVTNSARRMHPVCTAAVCRKYISVLKIFCTDDRAGALRAIKIDQN
jgi:hypothetical protein